MSKQIKLAQNDFELIQEAVLYMGKRFFAPSDTAALFEIEEKLDELRRDGPIVEGASLQMEPFQFDVFARALRAYADELNHPSTDSSNLERIRRLRSIGKAPSTGANVWGRIRNWLNGGKKG